MMFRVATTSMGGPQGLGTLSSTRLCKLKRAETMTFYIAIIMTSMFKIIRELKIVFLFFYHQFLHLLIPER